MEQETVGMMTALAGVAEAVGGLRKALPAEWNLDDLNEEVARIGRHMLDDAMNPEGEEAEPEHKPYCEPPGKPEPEAAPLRKAKKAKTAPAEDPEKGSEAKPRQIMGVCVECGVSYLKNGNNQKRCNECADKSKAAAQKAWQDKKRQEAGAGPDDRLARIKAANEKLDTITD